AFSRMLFGIEKGTEILLEGFLCLFLLFSRDSVAGKEAVFMIEIAVYHHDSQQRKKVVQDFINSLKQSRLYGEVYSIQKLQKFAEKLLNGKDQLDIICIDTAEKEYAQRLMEHTPSNPEYILLDTPAEEVSGYMRYKPAAWIHSDRDGQGEVSKAL